MATISNQYISKQLAQTHHTLTLMQQDEELLSNIEQAIDTVYDCLQNGGKVMFAGNGGSAADAQHMSAEFVARFMFDRSALASIALTTDTSALTAIGNDYGFEYLFSRQIEALGHKGDVLIAYSTSGTSPNILKAIEQAKSQHIRTIGFTGVKKQSSTMVAACDTVIRVPSEATVHIQEGHLMIGHILCGAVEQRIFMPQ